MKHLKSFRESLNEYPNEIVATKTLYQDENTFIWSDEFIDYDKCEGIYEPAHIARLHEHYNDSEGNKILVYYELENDGTLSSIISFYVDNLNNLIEDNLISIV